MRMWGQTGTPLSPTASACKGGAEDMTNRHPRPRAAPPTTASLTVALGTLVAAALIMPAGAARADHKVYSPNVTKGEFALEARGHLDVDDEDAKDGGQKQVYEVEYSVTDRWHTAVFGKLRKRPNGPLRYDLTAWENIIEVAGEGKYWVDFGLYFEFALADEDDDPNEFEWKLLFEKLTGPLRNRLNINFEEELGGEDENSTKLEYAWQTKWRTGTPIEAGFEAFGELGEISDILPLDEQEHQLGPVLWWELEIGERSKLEVQLGWLFGLTGATPDGTLKWIVEYEIQF
jgi:hypothetical protein